MVSGIFTLVLIFPASSLEPASFSLSFFTCAFVCHSSLSKSGGVHASMVVARGGGKTEEGSRSSVLIDFALVNESSASSRVLLWLAGVELAGFGFQKETRNVSDEFTKAQSRLLNLRDRKYIS